MYCAWTTNKIHALPYLGTIEKEELRVAKGDMEENCGERKTEDGSGQRLSAL